MTQEEVYFDIVKRYEQTSEEELLKELTRVANHIKEYRNMFSKVIASKLSMHLLATLSPLLDDSQRDDLVRDQTALKYLLYTELVVRVAMGAEDYVTLSPVGRMVCILMSQRTTRVTDRNTRLRRMLELVNLNSFSDYMEEQYNESVLELNYDVPTEHVVLKKITSNGSIKVNRLDLDPNKLLDFHTVKMFKDIETFLKLESSR
ncbi:hypothetical protein AGENTSMITH_49 [Bacillus phage vB_BspM_AgentSmith]|nr:hypothetical protein AGENTSMITH_49 [Bacillus phage vB_BspM_AgentSmith]